MPINSSNELSKFVSVAVPVPGLNLLIYRVPDGVRSPVRGARVLVPLGARTVTGFVTGTTSATAFSTKKSNKSDEDAFSLTGVKDILHVFDESPFVPADVVDLALWVAEYYAAGPGEALAAAMPPLALVESERHVYITPSGLERLQSSERTPMQERVLRGLSTSRSVRVSALAALIADDEVGTRKSRSRVRQELDSFLLALSRDGFVGFTQSLRKGGAPGFKTLKFVVLTPKGHACVSELNAKKFGAIVKSPAGGNRNETRTVLTSKQQTAVEVLASETLGMAVSKLAEHCISRDVLNRLAKRDFVKFRSVRVDRDPFRSYLNKEATVPVHEISDLTPEQERASKHLAGLVLQQRFESVLLHGVTGSGKTEVYLRTAKAAVQNGRGVLILVPEISLTPAVTEVFRTAFGERVAIQHSGLSNGERHDQWHRIRRGEVDVVVGTRSAVFAPLASLGLIVVDEEHDSSYKQEESPRYHARDVAVMRGKLANVLVVLGSATPSLETFQNALSGRYQKLVLDRRIKNRPLATVHIVDMREQISKHGPEIVISEPLREELSECLERREQALILLNRRGFSSSVFCRQCAGRLECPNCSVCLTVHRSANLARCHYCNFSVAIPTACPDCAGPYLEHIGIGTERVEAELAASFPEARLARLDRDTVRRRGAIGSLLGKFARREFDVLVGTQMISKGHDFPHVTLVGVISADVGLGLADFRASERTFQLLTQVSGRAGRGDRPGAAFIQTLYPNHYSIRHACQQNYQAFFSEEIQYRRAMRYPPSVALVNAVVRGRSLAEAMNSASKVVQRLRQDRHDFLILGPAPAPLSRLRGEHRVQLFLKGRNRNSMREALEASLVEANLRRRVIVDIDPLTVL